MHSEYLKQTRIHPPAASPEIADPKTDTPGVKKIVSLENFKLLKRPEGGNNKSAKEILKGEENKLQSNTSADPDVKIKAYEETRAKLFSAEGISAFLKSL